MPDQDTPPQRDEAVDHDLLTFGEAGARLHEEVAAHRQLVSRLQAHGPSPELDSAHTRLAALEDAAERNQRRPISGSNFDAFFGIIRGRHHE